MRKLIFILIALVSFSQAQTIQYIGGPTTTVISRGNFRADSIFYLPKRTKTPTDTAAFRYQISDSSLYYWTGYQWTKVQSASSFASVDTNIISTRAWRQKGIDSVQYNVGLKVNISDTASMLSPYIVGSGTSNYFPKFNATRSVINSKLYESNMNLLFNSTTPYLTTSGISTIENNGTSAALYVLKTLDTARAYLSFGGANTMDINNLRAGDIRFYTNATLRGRFQTDGTFRLNSLTGTGSRIVVADANGVLSATSSATGLVDTTVISTRAYRQKGDDSLGAIIATKGSGTVTSVATGYGLSGGTITTTGTISADTLNLSTRAWRQKGLDSLAALEISGSGTTNYIPKFTNTRELGNSNLINASSGDLLFGTTLNPYAATNRRTFEINGTNETVIALKRNDLDGAYLYANSNDFRIAQTQNLSMTFYTNNTERMRIFQNGRVFVGTSPTDAGYQFDVNGSGRFQQLTSSTNFLDFAHYFYNGGGTNDIYFSTRGNGAGSGNASIINTVSGGRLSFHTNGGAIRFGNTSQTAATANYLSIESNGEILINTTTDAGAYTLQNNGALYNTSSAILAATSGNVGIGTTSPISKLETLDGDISVSTLNSFSFFNTNRNTIPNAAGFSLGGIRYRGYSTGSTYQVGAQILAFSSAAWSSTSVPSYLSFQTTASGSTSPTERMVIDATGNVGIGTTSPDERLVVRNVNRDPTSAEFTMTVHSSSPQSANYGGSIGFIGSNDDAGTTQTSFAAIQGVKSNATSGNTAGDLRFLTRNAGAAMTEKVRITTSGETLFGTTTDAGDYKLQVAGNIYSTSSAVFAALGGNVGIGTTTPTDNYSFGKGLDMHGSNGSALYMRYATDPTVQYGAIGYDRTGLGLYLTTNNALPIIFATLNTQRGRINSAGEWLLNADGTDAGDYKLQVAGIIYNTGSAILAATSGNVGIGTSTPAAKLDVSSTTSGFLPPRMTTTQRDAISSPAAGLVIYNTTTSKLQVYTTSWTDLH